MTAEAETLQGEKSSASQVTQKEQTKLPEAQRLKLREAALKFLRLRKQAQAAKLEEINKAKLIEETGEKAEKEKKEKEKEEGRKTIRMKKQTLENVEAGMQQMAKNFQSKQSEVSVAIPLEVAQHVLAQVQDDTLSKLPDKAIIKRSQTLSKALEHSEDLNPDQITQITAALGKIKEQANARNITLEQKEMDDSSSESFTPQLIKQLGDTLASGAVITEYYEGEELFATKDPQTGRVTLKIPRNPKNPPTWKTFLKVATEIAPKTDDSQGSRYLNFSRNLKATAIYLSQQRRPDGTAYASDKVVEELYETGAAMDAAINGKTEYKKLSRVEIEQETKELMPLFYQNYPEQLQYASAEEIQRQTRERQKQIIAFVLGEGAEDSYYEKWFEHAKDLEKYKVDENGQSTDHPVLTHADFKEYLLQKQDLVMRRITPFLENARSQQRRREAIANQGQEIITRAIKEKGKVLEREMFSSMKFSKDQSNVFGELSGEVLPPATVIENVEKELQELLQKNPNATVEERLAALNKAVYDTYKSPDNLTDKFQQYAPLLALKNGELACVIRADVVENLSKIYITELAGDENGLVSLAGSTLLSEKFLGHEMLFMVDRNSLREGETPTLYAISTGGKNGSLVMKITDAQLNIPVLQKIKDAVLANPDDVNLTITFDFADESLEKTFGKHVNLTSSDKGLEAANWVNFAIIGIDAQGNKLDKATQLLFLNRANILAPNDVNVLRAMAKITEDDSNNQELHRTVLQKIHALFPDEQLTDEMIIKGDLTINALMTDVEINTLLADPQDQAYVRLILNPHEDQNKFTEADIDKARDILIKAYVNLRQSPQRNAQQLTDIQRLIGQVDAIQQNLRQEEIRRGQEEIKRGRRAQEKRGESLTLFQLTELNRKKYVMYGPVRTFMEENALDFANRWSPGVIPGGSAFEAFESKLRDVANFVMDQEYVTERMQYGLSYSEVVNEREEFLKLRNDLVNVVLATTFFQDGGEKALPEAESKLKSLNFDGIYRIRNLEDGRIGYLAQRYLQKLDLRRIADGGYLHTHSIKDVQNEIISEIYTESVVFEKGKYKIKYDEVRDEKYKEFAVAKYLKDTPEASMTEALRSIDEIYQRYRQVHPDASLTDALRDPATGIYSTQEQIDEVEESIKKSFIDLINSHLVIARWTTWAALDEPAITSKGIPKDKAGNRKMEYTGRPSLWSHMQDMIRWGSLTDQQADLLWGPFRRRVISSALKSLVVKHRVPNDDTTKYIDKDDGWHPDSASMQRQDAVTDAFGVKMTRFAMVENDDFINQVGFLSDRAIDSIWRMGDRGGMERPYLDILYSRILKKPQGYNINGDWADYQLDQAGHLIRVDKAGRVINYGEEGYENGWRVAKRDRDGYEEGLDLGLFLQLHTAVSNVPDIDRTRQKRYELWAGRIAKYQPEIAMKQVYEKDPYGNKDFKDFWNNAEWLKTFYNAKMNTLGNTNSPNTYDDVLNRKVGEAVEEHHARIDQANKERVKMGLTKLDYKGFSEIQEVVSAKFRYEIFMENFSEKLWEYREKSFNLETPEAIDFGSSAEYRYKDANGIEVTGNWITDPDGMNEYYSKITNNTMNDVGAKVQELMNAMTVTIRGGQGRGRLENEVVKENSIAWQLGCDAKYQAQLYRRALSDRDSLMEQKRYRSDWNQDLSNKSTNLSALIGDLTASEQIMNIFVNRFMKAEFNNREEIFKACMEAAAIAQSPKGEAFRTKIIDDWAGFYLYTMKLGSNERFDPADPMGAFLNFIGHNPTRAPWARNMSLIKKEYGPQMIGYSDEELEGFVRNELSLYLQGDPIRAAEFYRFLGISEDRMRNRSILRFLASIIVASMMEATGTSVDLFGNQQAA